MGPVGDRVEELGRCFATGIRELETHQQASPAHIAYERVVLHHSPQGPATVARAARPSRITTLRPTAAGRGSLTLLV